MTYHAHYALLLINSIASSHPNARNDARQTSFIYGDARCFACAFGNILNVMSYIKLWAFFYRQGDDVPRITPHRRQVGLERERLSYEKRRDTNRAHCPILNTNEEAKQALKRTKERRPHGKDHGPQLTSGMSQHSSPKWSRKVVITEHNNQDTRILQIHMYLYSIACFGNVNMQLSSNTTSCKNHHILAISVSNPIQSGYIAPSLLQGDSVGRCFLGLILNLT